MKNMTIQKFNQTGCAGEGNQGLLVYFDNEETQKNPKYKEFVKNYQPFEWEINPSDFRDYMKGKHSFIINFG